MHSLLSQVAADSVPEAKPEAAPVHHRAVLLVNLGTPDRADIPSVRRYLAEFLSDPEVIRLPTGLGWLNRPLGRLIAQFRASASAERYERIWSEEGSPLKTITRSQARALEEALPRGWRVFFAMRYGQPGIAETLDDIRKCGCNELVVVPMYPQFSGSTTGTALRVVYNYLEGKGRQLHVTTRSAWYDDHGYVNAQARLIEQYARSSHLTPDNTYLLFSGHGMPESYVRRGDPYPRHVVRTVALVGQRLGWPADRLSLAYQSHFGPGKWLRPYTDEALEELTRAGEKRVMVCPISFTADCLETLEEIDLCYRASLERAGVELYLCPALDTFGPFISALKHLVLRGPRPMTCSAARVRSFEPTRAKPGTLNGDIDSLVMIGLSTPGRLGTAGGPALACADAAALRRVKRSQCQVPALLRTVHETTDIREAWLLNTCRRFELYGWLPVAEGAVQYADTVARIRRRLFEDHEPDDGAVNVLYGVAAWHHLLRTASGLNSSLPGERDVLEQLQGAHRLAERSGTAGPLTRCLLDDLLAFERDIRGCSEWGRYSPDYTYAALSRIAVRTRLDFAALKIVVVGGSTTSAAVLRTLIERFDVPGRQLTLLYRGHKHGGQVKMLRKAIGGGRRVRVQSYAEQSVTRAIADADVVVFGIDREEPVLDAGRLRACRDFVARPLTVFDFNMFGSTTGIGTLEGVALHDAKRLEAEVTAFADEMCAAGAFAQAVEAVERSVIEHISTVDPPSGDDAERCAARCHGNKAAAVVGDERS